MEESYDLYNKYAMRGVKHPDSNTRVLATSREFSLGTKAMDDKGNEEVCLKGSRGDQQGEATLTTTLVTENMENAEIQGINQQVMERNAGGEMEENSGNSGFKEKEAILSKLEKLRIEEGKRVVNVEDNDIEDTDRELTYMIACKILSVRSVNDEYFIHMMPRIWGIEGYVKIENAGKNIFQCKFRFLRDKTRIIRGGPWSFDNAMLIFEELKGNCSLESLEFRYVSF